jgi:hypothetical protein
MDGVIVSEDPEWMDAADISGVPDEHIDHWLSYCLHSAAPFSEIQHNAKHLLVNLRMLRARRLWENGLIEECATWEDVLLKRFRITPEQFAWLELGEPVIADTDTVEQAIEKGKEIAASKKIKEAKQQVLDFNPTAEGKGLTKAVAELLGADGVNQDDVAELFDISQQAVSKALKNTTKSSDSEEEVVIPDHLHGSNEKADFRKLSPEGQERVRQKEPLNRVAIAEGVRQPPDHLKLAKSHFLKMTAEQRTAFDEWRSGL